MNLTVRHASLLLSAALFVQSATALAQETPTELPVIRLTAGINVIQAESAIDDPQREKGLMFRTAMGANQGMVFTFSELGQECMWMKNTLIPLSVAFMDDTGKITNIEDMAAQTLDNHCSRGTARYALEMNLGWFQKHGVQVGMTIHGLPAPSTAR